MLTKKVEILDKEIRSIEDEIDRTNFNANELRAREMERNNLDQQIMSLTHKLDNILS